MPSIHRQPRGARGGDHVQAFAFHLHQGGRVDRLDLRHHQVGMLGLDHAAQRGAVQHVDHVAAVRHLHRRRVGVTVHRDHFHRIALQLDRHLLAELAGTQQQHAHGMIGIRRAEGFHPGLRSWKCRIVNRPSPSRRVPRAGISPLELDIILISNHLDSKA